MARGVVNSAHSLNREVNLAHSLNYLVSSANVMNGVVIFLIGEPN